MINPLLLIQLSETEKRFIFILLLAFVVAIILVAGIGYIIIKVIRIQGSKLDTAVHDAVITKVITNEKHFKKYAWKKNCQLFLKQAWVPVIIILAGAIALLIRAIAVNDWTWNYNPFNHKDGFMTLLWAFDFSKTPTTKVFGLTIMSNWPPLLEGGEPKFVLEAWASYLFVPCLIVGGIWYILVVQAFFARLYRTVHLSRTIFEKSLENYNQTRGFTDGGTPQPVINPAPAQSTLNQPVQNNQPQIDNAYNPYNQNNNGSNFPPYNG